MPHERAKAQIVRVGVWSRKGRFLGTAEVPAEDGEALPDHVYLCASTYSGGEGLTLTAHRFPGGYRVRAEGGDEVLWLAPVEEGEESYMGLFSEEELNEVLQLLASAPAIQREGRG